MTLPPWLSAALDYLPFWLGFQMQHSEQPGCVVAVAHRGEVVLEQAFGHADATRSIELTARHRFRVASHSKSFTAAGMMKLREQGRLRLDDRAGQHVADLHPQVGDATIAQLLCHTAGIVRDGTDSGYWTDRRPYPNVALLEADLRAAPTIAANTRFKYSNHAFALAGFVIEAVTNEPYLSWIKREIVDAAGLRETVPDMPLPPGSLLALGHSLKQPLGRRVAFPGDAATHALASATGFISTAADLALFFDQLSPQASASVLSVESRREMVRRQWRVPLSSVGSDYGLGLIGGELDGWEWFGHSGGFQGYITRTIMLPEPAVSVSVLTNAADGPAQAWVEGAVHILRCFSRGGPPSPPVSGWTGRWWDVWGAVDLVPMGEKVLVAAPASLIPFLNASELEIIDDDHGRITLAGGFANHGEPVHRVRGEDGSVSELWLAGSKLLPDVALAREMQARYGTR